MLNNCARWLLLAAVVLSTSIAMARTEPNSFLNKPASTTSALVNQVKSDPVVASRYTRHFGMTKTEVEEYFKTLKLSTLEEDGVYLVYNVPDTEEVRARAIFYKKGTKVWIDQNGGLVLKASCGNPMARGTDVQTVPITSEVDAVTNLTERPTEIIAKTDTILETSATPVPVAVESSALAFPTAPPASIASLGGGGFNPLILAPLGAIPFVIKGKTPNDPVPEPTTMLVIGAGATALIAKKRKKA